MQIAKCLRSAVFALGTLLISQLTTASTMSFDVYAAANSSVGGTGLDTGLFFEAGEIISGFVATDDLWSAGALPRWSNADGLLGNLFATGSDESGQSSGTLIGRSFGLYTREGFTAPYGALVGRINTAWFLLGTDFSVLAPEAGVLSLFYWDSNRGDNNGYVSVNIGVSEVPVPTAVWLFGSGLFLFMNLSKRRIGSAGT